MLYNSYAKGSVSLKRPREDSAASSSQHLPSKRLDSSESNQRTRVDNGTHLETHNPNIYQPQNQLSGAHRDRVCTYDRSNMDNMDGLDKLSSSKTAAATYSGANTSMLPSSTVVRPSYIPETGKPVPRPPQHPTTESRNVIAAAPSSAQSDRPLQTSSPSSSSNPYLKSNGAARPLLSSSPSNPYTKSSSAKGPIGGRTVLNNSSPRNPYAKPAGNAGIANTGKPACVRSLLPPTNNPYSKPSRTLNASKPSPKPAPLVVVDAANSQKPSYEQPTTTTTPLPKQFTNNPYQARKNLTSDDSPSRQLPQTSIQPSPELSAKDPQIVVLDPPAARTGAAPVSNNPYQNRKAPTLNAPIWLPPPTSRNPPSESSSKDLEVVLFNPSTQSRPLVRNPQETKKKEEPDVVVLDPPPHAAVPSKDVNVPVTVVKTNNQMASMRPTSWTTAKPAAAASNPTPSQTSLQSVATNRPELPGEAHLPPELVYDPNSIKPIKDEYRNQLTTNARLEQPLLNGWTLYRHQKRAILKGLMKRRVVLALDMGLGKTLIGCVWSRAFKQAFDGLKIIVVCPVSVKSEWKRTAEAATGIQVEDEKKAPKDSLDMSIVTWAKVPTSVDRAVDHFVAIFDEAHNMQSMDSNRTQAALKLVRDKRCVGVLLLTGTPMKNGKPCNLFPLLKAVDHPLGRHQKAYERHFCQGRMASFGRGQQWIASGQANLKQLHRMIESNLLHMTKDEYLKELPPMKRETRRVPVSASFQKQYNDKVKNLAKLKEAMKTNKNLDNKALLGSTQELRVSCAFAKIGATVEVAKKILEDEPSIVIFTNFAKAAKSMNKHLEDHGWTTALLTGETPAKKRQDLVDGFQVRLF
jgi:superfamily II DNA or RNA helicase